MIFSIAMGADYSFDIKSGFSIVPAFSLHNNFDIASVKDDVKYIFTNFDHMDACGSSIGVP